MDHNQQFPEALSSLARWLQGNPASRQSHMFLRSLLETGSSAVRAALIEQQFKLDFVLSVSDEQGSRMCCKWLARNSAFVSSFRIECNADASEEQLTTRLKQVLRSGMVTAAAQGHQRALELLEMGCGVTLTADSIVGAWEQCGAQPTWEQCAVALAELVLALRNIAHYKPLSGGDLQLIAAIVLRGFPNSQFRVFDRELMKVLCCTPAAGWPTDSMVTAINTYVQPEDIIWMHNDARCPWDAGSRVLQAAIQRGWQPLEVGQLLRLGCPSDADVMQTACQRNWSAADLIYLHQSGVPWGCGVMGLATACGKTLINLLQLRDAGCPWDGEVAQAAVVHGWRLEAVLELLPAGCQWHGNVVRAAIVHGWKSEDVLKLPQAGCPWGEGAMQVAIQRGESALIMKLHQAGCPWDSRSIELALNRPLWRQVLNAEIVQIATQAECRCI